VLRSEFMVINVYKQFDFFEKVYVTRVRRYIDESIKYFLIPIKFIRLGKDMSTQQTN